MKFHENFYSSTASAHIIRMTKVPNFVVHLPWLYPVSCISILYNVYLPMTDLVKKMIYNANSFISIDKVTIIICWHTFQNEAVYKYITFFFYLLKTFSQLLLGLTTNPRQEGYYNSIGLQYSVLLRTLPLNKLLSLYKPLFLAAQNSSISVVA